ncbi:class III lanthionine synthetase LanKC [Microbacterium sp. CJ88]|uniref:class III lanthionine synthetase LanKC n=1 Tax=Microbacterium sp. CJ88 TaxID=3445672 RepID=UPI003F655C28
MDPIYPRFSTASGEFYDDPRLHQANNSTSPFVPSPDLDWTSWTQASDGHWVYRAPNHHVLPEQGWKVHLSTIAAEATEVLDAAARYCHAGRIAFKHLVDNTVLFATNSKDADRSASGKFITIYPTSTDELERSVKALARLTTGKHGPHILSDLRWQDTPVFVRYGAFRHMFTDVAGVRVPAIRTPAGELVADVRGTGFHLPEWVDPPEFLRASVAEQRNSVPPPGFPEVQGVLHYSNGGGVYEAVENNVRVILKEARPFAGLTPDGRDAIERIGDEANTLNLIRDSHVVRAHRTLDLHGHRYLVTEKVPGVPLSRAVVSRHPLVRAGFDAVDLATYRDWALNITARLERAVAAVHGAGFTHGDLHPGNFLITEGNDVVLIDFEMAMPVGQDAAAVIGAPGFVPGDGRRGIALDRYALACVKLFLFAPLTPLLHFDLTKTEQLVQWARARFGLSDQWAAGIIADLSPRADDPTDAHVAQIASQLLADATPERQDRLWPGDPRQFDEPTYGLAHGALGPLLALHAARITIPDPLLEWTERAVRTEEDVRPGLLDGLAGAALGLHRLGRSSASQEALARLREIDTTALGPDLYSGLAGIGFAYLELADTYPELISAATDVASMLRQRQQEWDTRTPGPVATGAAGLLRGPSGAALFALRLFDRTGESDLLTFAEAAIRADLKSCVSTVDGSLQVDEGWRLLPYLGSGAAGIALAAMQLLQRSPISDLWEELRALELAAQSEFAWYGLRSHVESNNQYVKADAETDLGNPEEHRPRGYAYHAFNAAIAFAVSNMRRIVAFIEAQAMKVLDRQTLRRARRRTDEFGNRLEHHDR